MTRPVEPAGSGRAADRPAHAAAERAGAGFLQALPQTNGCRAFAPASNIPCCSAPLEYALIRARDFTASHAEAQTRDEWRRYRAGCGEAHNIDAPIGLLEHSYSWADGLATHFAQTYRSGNIFNFLLGGVAVCLGLAAFVAPSLHVEEAALELLITLAILLNAIIGKRREWHRRWLDYRQLAERLRPMRSLKLLGIAAPDPPGTETNPVPKRWIDWYASGIWRAMACPSGTIDRNCAARLGEAIAVHEIEPQVGYHLRNAEQIESWTAASSRSAWCCSSRRCWCRSRRSSGSGSGPFRQRYGNWFTLVSAGFPALGTAVFGIRFQADFGGDALRSKATAETLRQIDASCARSQSFARRRPCRAGGADHVVRPRRVAPGQPAARPFGRLALAQSRDGVDQASSTGK